MIKIFGKTDTSFTSNGDYVIQPLKAKVHKEDNGDYYLDIETSRDHVEYLVEGNIIVAPTPTGDQAFRLSNVQTKARKITAKCKHVFYDGDNRMIAEASNAPALCGYQMDMVNNAAYPASVFNTSSDITGNKAYECKRITLTKAFMELAELFGGHLVRDNYSVAINASIGTDKGLVIRYGKNLKELTVSEDWSQVCTTILPVGKDGALLNLVDPTASVYMSSASQYSIPYCKTVTFDQKMINRDNYPTEAAYKADIVADLTMQASDYLTAHHDPKVTYTLKGNLEVLSDIGDTIQVIDERIGINMMTHIISFDYDCLTGRYTDVQFGNLGTTAKGLANNVDDLVEKQKYGNVDGRLLVFNGDGSVSWVNE